MCNRVNFRKWLNERELADTTVHGYALNVASFESWYQLTNGVPAVDPAMLTRADVRDFRGHLERHKKAPATINRYLQALRIWCECLVEHGLMTENLLTNAKRAKETELAPRWPERNEYAALERELARAVNNARTPAATFLATRDRAIVLLLANTGLRVAELCALEPGDLKISERAGSVLVRHGKGDKRRTVPVINDARLALAPWLALRSQHAVYLFTDLAGASLRPWGVQTMLKRYCRRAGIAITPHQLRHYLAKSLIDRGVAITEVAAILGHDSLNTTKRYTMPSERDLERALETLEN